MEKVANRTEHCGAEHRGSVEQRTQAAYARNAEQYADKIGLMRSEVTDDVLTFVKCLPPGKKPVLDWGCGAGETAAYFAGERLIKMEVTDASPEMVDIARGLGHSPRVEPFEALDPAPGQHRGIWATASLNHAPREMVPDLVRLGVGTLVENGLFHLNMKSGPSPGVKEGRDSLDRWFGYWELDEVTALMRGAGLSLIYAIEWEGPSLYADSERYALALGKLKAP